LSDAGWIRMAEEKPNPKQLAEICLNVRYQGLFSLIFYCYYAFPTSYPEDISNIFGEEYFKQVIEPEARDEFLKTIRETQVEAVVTFNKGSTISFLQTQWELTIIALRMVNLFGVR
jgi:hypothetical protein